MREQDFFRKNKKRGASMYLCPVIKCCSVISEDSVVTSHKSNETFCATTPNASFVLVTLEFIGRRRDSNLAEFFWFASSTP